MKKLVMALLVAGLLTLSVGCVAFAGKGGCPNDNAAIGAAQANDNSAHGNAKQADNGCAGGGGDDGGGR
jgi:hypothetical protein